MVKLPLMANKMAANTCITAENYIDQFDLVEKIFLSTIFPPKNGQIKGSCLPWASLVEDIRKLNEEYLFNEIKLIHVVFCSNTRVCLNKQDKINQKINYQKIY